MGRWEARAQNSQGENGNQISKVFAIALENHNWTQPANQFTGPIQQIFQNPNAPFINGPVNGTAIATTNGRQVNISQPVAYATNYTNVLATASGNNPHVHPSEPNYVWAEAGYNFRIGNDDDPFVPNGSTNQVNNLDNQLHLAGRLTQAGRSWQSYQKDIDLTTVSVQLTNVVLPPNQWTVPINSFSGNFASGVNQFNGSTQYNYAVKHNPMAFFTDTQRRRRSHTCQSLVALVCPAAAVVHRPGYQQRSYLQLDHVRPVQRHAHRPHGRVYGVDRRRRQHQARRQLPEHHKFPRSWPRRPTRTTARSSSGGMNPKQTGRATTPMISTTPLVKS